MTVAMVVCPIAAGERSASADARRPAERLDEAVGLARAIDLDVRATEILRIRIPNPRTLFGKGQVEKLSALVRAAEAELVVVDSQLTPLQQKSLEDAFSAKVVDRTGLILEIFGERAVTAEGRLQVELAHLRYQAGRLVRSWTHLERQRGGYGFLGGPGERQIETDRRLLRNRIVHLEKQLDGVRRTRSLHRTRRRRAGLPAIALVGYTNAGKSTLFNRLTHAAVTERDQLFATLDPTIRKLVLPDRQQATLSDTVGFVSDLPTELIAAFRATLEEVTEADLLIHVRDISDAKSEAQKKDVEDVLASLGVTEGEGRVPVIEAWNKADLLTPEELSLALARIGKARPPAVLVSAREGEVGRLLHAIATALHGSTRTCEMSLHPSDGQRYAWLHAHGDVITEEERDGTLYLTVRLSPAAEEEFRAL